MKHSAVKQLTLLQGNFIVATPLLEDPLFKESLIFISEFKEFSSYGFMIDHILQPSSLKNEIKAQLKNTIFENSEIYFGGPMNSEYHFMIHTSDIYFKNSFHVNDSICITNLSDALENFDEGPSFYRIYSGYCNWQCGQLNQEVKTGFWLVKNFNHDLLFSYSKNKWKNCLNSFDFDVKKFAINNGYA